MENELNFDIRYNVRRIANETQLKLNKFIQGYNIYPKASIDDVIEYCEEHYLEIPEWMLDTFYYRICI